MLTPLCLPPPKKLFLTIILTTDPQISLFAQLGGGGVQFFVPSCPQITGLEFVPKVVHV